MRTRSAFVQVVWRKRLTVVLLVLLSLMLAARATATQTFHGTYRSSLSSSWVTGWKYQVLYTFSGGADGNSPFGGLTPDFWGNLYGTTSLGGAYGGGVVFKLDPHGKETVVYSFALGADGFDPETESLTLDPQGNIYGTTVLGGLTSCGNSGAGCGVAFKLTPAGKETVLHSFSGGSDGGNPFAGLIRDEMGNLYGTSYGGYSGGAIFEISARGQFFLIHTFHQGRDGGCPWGNLILDRFGNLYGAGGCGGLEPDGPGVIFKFSPNGKETILHYFTGGDDGSAPQGPLLRDFWGNIYGTTTRGGHFGNGVVYKLDPWGRETVLYSFKGGADGGYANGGVVSDFWGNLYGTTFEGGAFGYGVVFKIDRWGRETVLYAFQGQGDGGNPLGEVLLRDFRGNLYGTTNAGGSLPGVNGPGVVFKLSPE